MSRLRRDIARRLRRMAKIKRRDFAPVTMFDCTMSRREHDEIFRGKGDRE